MTKSTQSKRNRGNEPKTLTKLKLCARAGGRCQFEGCNKKLFIDGITLTDLNNSNIAHIVASSPDGPRGNEHSYELSDEIENLMLMCQEHHKLIDDKPEIYTTQILKNMKNEQEIRIEELLNEMNYPKSEIIMFESPIKNEMNVKVNFKQAVDAVRASGYNPASNHGVSITINSFENYRSSRYWESVERDLIDKVKYQIESLYRCSPDLQLAIFPIAPIPLIVKLGNLLGDKRKIDIYQKFREPDTWKWQRTKLLNSFSTEKKEISKGDKIALVISITSNINLERVTNVDRFDVIYHLKAQNFGTNAIQNIKDLEAFWQEYLSICEKIKNEDKASEISLFPAVPVSIAFEIGRRYMPKVYPKMRVFDECDGFFETIKIGGRNDE